MLTIVVAARLVIAGVDLLVRTITAAPATTGRRWWRGTRIVVAVIGVFAAGAIVADMHWWRTTGHSGLADGSTFLFWGVIALVLICAKLWDRYRKSKRT